MNQTKSPSEYKNAALEILNNNNWGEAIGVTVVGAIISGAASLIPFGGLIIGGPIALGLTLYYLNLSRGAFKEFNQLFSGFNNFGNALLAYFLMILIVVLGIILLIVPGIIAALALSQTFYVMNDNPGISATDAMSKSHEMMKGHRMDLFILYLSFIGWALLCVLTLGLGFIVLGPYITTSATLFYNDLANHKGEELEQLASGL